VGLENPVHLLFLGAVALVVLGPKRLPELARAAGKGIREFREAMSGVVDGTPNAEGDRREQGPPPP
jgi:sec-independent protein translocase protein TatA